MIGMPDVHTEHEDRRRPIPLVTILAAHDERLLDEAKRMVRSIDDANSFDQIDWRRFQQIITILERDTLADIERTLAAPDRLAHLIFFLENMLQVLNADEVVARHFVDTARASSPKFCGASYDPFYRGREARNSQPPPSSLDLRPRRNRQIKSGCQVS